MMSPMAGEPPRPAASRRPSPAEPPEGLPAQVGRYRVLRKLGSGGMGTVYLAEDPALHRTVALKVLVKTENTPANLIRRFHAEAQTAAKLRHPNIVTVFDSGEANGHLFLALEYIDGPDLEKVIRKRGRVPVERTVEIVRQIALALDHAHSLGIVHRDIKPSNILLRRDGTATLTDLGLARAIDETAASGITRAGYTVGTVDYMAPEQARSSKSADVRSDLYSLGCTWFHMLAGRVPYHEGDLTNKLRAHAHSPPPDPREADPDIPPGVVAVLQRLMAKKPEDRYQTPAALLADLNRPGLCRKAVTADDLRSLAEESDSGPMTAVRFGEWSDDQAVPSGSTMVEAVARPSGEVRFEPFRPPPRKPAPRKPADAAKFEKAEKIRAAVVFGAFAVLFAVVIWALSQLDRWFGGAVPPPPAPQGAPATGPAPETPAPPPEVPVAPVE
ncbi:MAG TPA: serine/threonine-protein kinase, partial [Planctomycetaceae bacterium]